VVASYVIGSSIGLIAAILVLRSRDLETYEVLRDRLKKFLENLFVKSI